MNILFIPARNALKTGLLYNRPTVEDVRGLAPLNWRIMTVADAINLINYSGGELVAGGELKALTGWTAPNTGATDSKGFKALPAGQRDNLGEFSGILTKTIFWIK